MAGGNRIQRIEQAINEGSADVNIVPPTKEVRMGDTPGEARGQRGNVEIVVTGWSQSSAASNPDGGKSALISFLERKSGDKSLKLKNVSTVF